MASSFAPLTPTHTLSFHTTSVGTQLFVQPENKNDDEVPSSTANTALDNLPKFMAMGMIALSTMFGPIQGLDSSNVMHPTVPVANAIESRIIGELKGSGLVFKVRIPPIQCNAI